MNTISSLFVERNKLSDQVANKIQALIIDGDLKPGVQLPPERILVEQLGVSRTVIREATRLLQERGLVRVITGSGTYIAEPDSTVVSQSLGVLLSRQQTSFKDLIEIRRFLEVEIACKAAQKAAPEHLDRLHIALVAMITAIPEIEITPDGLEKFVLADLKFHNILAEATENSLFPVLLSSIVDLLSDFRRKASSYPGAPQAAVEYHRQIIECVREHDVAKVRQVMTDHMAHAEDVVTRLDIEEQRLKKDLKG